ncbi:MAG: HEAT repeat domain-containing protein, partial [Pyrinomonadaceae bacterium]|nr:HEAT repeat domain-containing protein [Pyrinomonadaceae bacterium]
SGDVEAKREALFQIRNLRSAEASRLAIPALKDANEIVRATAAGSSVFAPPLEVLPRLLPLLEDRAPFVRREAAYALGKVGDIAASKALVETLRADKDLEVRAAAAVALGTAGDGAAVSPLVAVLDARIREEHEFLRRSAARSIGQIAERARSLGPSRLTPENFLPEKYKSASEVEPTDLTKDGGPFARAIRTLTTVVNNKLEAQDTRREAAFAIGAIGSPSSVSLLESLAKSEDPYLAEISREALLKVRKQ